MSNLASLQQRSEDAQTRVALIEQALKNQEVPQVISAAIGAITPGVEQVFLTGSGVQALTLANPVAGAPGLSGGQDGFKLTITDVGGHAHTITTGTNGLNGSKHIATFGGSVGSSVTLTAYNGSWYAPISSGVTLS